ncbi:uncharacterized protein LOC120704510 isoform X2 [Panicum virgatum]|uniref:uncharacterized protein LOC120704510 isoform X2 n=1 Tax=Panicum virgatum TaxID=38727 RepID=UPI0019D668C6|nr:uncharacterized protein LOC120704510 isoform X2 [Panicum virgatum]
MTPARPERVSSLGPPPPVLTSARARRGIWSALRHHRRTSQPCPPCAHRDPDRVATVAYAGHLLLAFTHQPLPHPLSPPAHLTCHLAAAATIPNGGCNFLLSSTNTPSTRRRPPSIRFNEWLYPTAYQFLISEGIAKNVVERMKITFHTMPLSIKPLEQFLSEHGSLISIKSIFKGSYKLCVAHDIGMVLVHGFLEEILKNHRKYLSWNGGFNKSDLVVVNSMECRITKRSTQGGCHCRAKDLHKIGEIFMPMFSCSRGMALYFDVLQKDLSMASDTEVKEEWFWEYLLSHPALKRSMARYDLECGLHAAITFGGPGTRIQSILGVYSTGRRLSRLNLLKTHLSQIPACIRFSGLTASLLKVLIILLRLQLGGCLHTKEISCNMVMSMSRYMTPPS